MTLLIAALVARSVLIIVFALAGATKLANPDQTRAMLAAFGVNARWLTTAAAVLPLAELAIAATLISPPTAFVGALTATAALAGFTIVIIVSLARGLRPSCNCFGLLGSSPIGAAIVLRNTILTGLALLVVAAGSNAAATWRLDLLFGVTPLEALVGVSAVLTLLLLVLILTVQLIILQRLAEGQPDSPRGISHLSPMANRGLPEGALAPGFGLADTHDEFVTLDQLLAQRLPLILLFTKPDCPPCIAMSMEVERWQRSHADQLLIVRIVDAGGAFEHYALLQTKGEVASAYDCWGTPCAVLVTPDGRIGSLTAQGAAEIRALVKRTAAAALKASFK